MLKVAAFLLGGFGLIGGGFYILFLSLRILSERGDYGFIIIFSFPLVGAGVFLLYLASKGKGNGLKADPKVKNPTFEEKLEKDEEIVAVWQDTNQKREKLRSTEMIAAEQLRENSEQTG